MQMYLVFCEIEGSESEIVLGLGPVLYGYVVRGRQGGHFSAGLGVRT